MDKNTLIDLIEKQKQIVKSNEELYDVKVAEINLSLQKVVKNLMDANVTVQHGHNRTMFCMEREPGNSWTMDVELVHEDVYKTYEEGEIPELKVKLIWGGRNAKIDEVTELQYGVFSGKMCEDLMGAQTVIKACLDAREKIAELIKEHQMKENKKTLSQLEYELKEQEHTEAKVHAMGQIKQDAVFDVKISFRRGRSFKLFKNDRVQIIKFGRKNVVLNKFYFSGTNEEWIKSSSITYMSIETLSDYIQQGFLEAVG